MTSEPNPTRGWLCKPCNLHFSSWEAIFQHKQSKRQSGYANHIHCKFCGQDFKTQAAEILHIKQYHPQPQKLECPGCGQGPFSRLAGLISHIEGGDCLRIDSTVLDELREKKLAFPRQLAHVTNESVKHNYTSFVTPTKESDSVLSEIWDASTDAEEFHFRKSDFPALANQVDPPDVPKEEAKPTVDEDTKDKKTILAPDTRAWLLGTTKDLFKDAEPKPAQKPDDIQLALAAAPSARSLFEALDEHDPSHPSYNVARYYSDIVELFICPKVRCGKTFKKGTCLTSHLRSSAHGDKEYRCPACFRIFKTLTAIASHAESSSVKCRIRDTDNYEAYLDQLTAGIINVGERYEDGTLQYTTAEGARAMLGQSFDKDVQVNGAVW